MATKEIKPLLQKVHCVEFSYKKHLGDSKAHGYHSTSLMVKREISHENLEQGNRKMEEIKINETK